jgi:hypothetical protein
MEAALCNYQHPFSESKIELVARIAHIIRE